LGAASLSGAGFAVFAGGATASWRLGESGCPLGFRIDLDRLRQERMRLTSFGDCVMEDAYQVDYDMMRELRVEAMSVFADLMRVSHAPSWARGITYATS
jgi:hypothetical protein